ncbi:unnamed protein product [Caenorhabditis nigoni]
MLPDEAEQYSDDVCICGNAASQNYCDDKTNKGYCTIGQISWWHDYNEISTTVTPGPPVIISTIIDNVTVTLQESLTNAGVNDHKDIIVSAFLNCTEGVCQYKTTVTNYGPGYYDYTVGDNKCTSPTCSGSFLKGYRAPVIIQRKNQNLEILAYQYTNGYPEVTVLGCGSGLILHDTCQRSLGNAYFDSQYYNDIVCSCQGAKMGCDDLTQIAVCIGGTITWWTNTPGSTYPTSSSIATTTFPPQDPNVFHLTFFLSEFTYDGSPDYDKNVTLDVNMNCSAIECDYSVLIREYAQNYYTIYVNGEECPGSHCTSKFSKYHSIPVHLARVSEYLNLFDLEFQDTPNVKVLGCTYGMLDNGGCRSSQYFDDKIQKDDVFCVCQSSELKCDQGVEPGFCSDGDPVWWKSISDISSSTSATTSSGTWSTTFFIGFNETVPTGTQRVSIETTLECPDSSCTFKITVNEIDQDYFRVYQDHADCTTHSCAGTFFQTQSIHIYLRRADGSGVMDLFDLRFKEVVVLNCTDGWLEPGKCLKAKKGDDEMCSCQDTSYNCGSIQEYSSCLSGTPVWWAPNDQSSTSIGTTSLATSSLSPITSTTSGTLTTTFFIGFNETVPTGTQRVSIETTLECPDSSCTFKITVNEIDQDYFRVYQDHADCTTHSCAGTFFQTQSIHIYLRRADGSGVMDLFDLRFKEVVVLNCTDGWLEPGKCLKAKKGDDEMCSCQDTSYNCGSIQEYSSCLSGTPVWWAPNDQSSTSIGTTSLATSSLSPITSTTSGTLTTTFFIGFNETVPTGTQRVSIETTLECPDSSCTFKITVNEIDQDYFRVYQDHADCTTHSCAGTFFQTQSIHVYLRKADGSGVMDLFDLRFKEVVVLNCTDGWLEPGKCLKAKNGDDEMCSCQDTSYDCGSVQEYSSCLSGTPVWWAPNDQSSTSIGTTSLATSSTSPSTSTSSRTWTTTFFIGFNETVTAGTQRVAIETTQECPDSSCTFKITVNEIDQDYFRVYQDHADCTTHSCAGTFFQTQSIHIYLRRADGSGVMDLFDLRFKEVVVLNCTDGWLEPGKCLKAKNGDDEMCSCQDTSYDCGSVQEYSSCLSGTPVWWAPNDQSSTSIRTTSLATSSPSPSTSTSSGTWTTTFFIGFNETVPTGTQRVSIEAELECPDSSCTFKITANEIDQDYFRVYQDHADCTTHSCAGTFFQTQSIHIYLRKADGSGVMDLFDLRFKEVVVLNCTDGWLEPGKCLKAKNGDDEMCSCQDTSYDCGSVQEYSSCLSGTPVWWAPDDHSSTSIATTSLATSSPSPSTSTSSGTWSTTFFIGFSETVPAGTQRVSIETTLECPDSSCTFKITVNENAKDYFWIYQDNTECTDNPCAGTFFQTQSIHIYLYKVGGIMDLFDLRFKEVVVLNCTSGWVEPGKCLKAKNGDDEMCSCQGTSYDCGSVQDYSSCLAGTPVWWSPDNELSTEASTTSLATSSPSSPTTTESAYTTTVIIQLIEHQGPDNQQISTQTTLRCQDESCTYDIEVDNYAEDYFSVSLDDQNCYPSCHGSFYFTDTCRFYVYKGDNQKMDLFDLKFKNVTILGCTNGWLEPGKCLKAKNGNDEMCSCQDADSNCNGVSKDSECQSGTPLWWQPDHTTSTISTLSTSTSTPANQYVTVSASLSEDLTTDPYNFNIVTVIGVMNCTESACQYGVTVVNQNPDYYLVLRNGEDCPAPCQGTIAHGDPSVIITVHRKNQHLDFMEFQFQNAPKILIMGCEAMGRDGGPDLISLEDNYQCLHIFETTSLGTNKYFDDVCLCKESGDKCDNQTPVGKCTSGKVQWWQDDFMSTVPTTTVTTTAATTTEATTTVTTTPSTTTVPTTTTVATTTVPTDSFSFEISLTEGRNNRKNQMMVSSEMDCDSEKCDFWIKVDNRAQTWFKVYMDSEECQNHKCSGSVVPGASANVTIYRGTEVLDFFDFQYKNIVVLGCDNGLLDYGSCVRMTKAVPINGQEYIDEICSCRSREMDCRNVKEGVCVNEVQTWWKDAPRTSTTGVTSSEATTVLTTTATTVPSLQDLANGGVDLSNVTQVLNDTEHYSKQGMALNHTQIFDITKILHNSANLPGISQENAIQILQNMDQCLNAHKEQVRRGQTREFRLLDVLRPMVMNTKDKFIQYLDGKNLGFNAKKVNCQSENHTDDGLIDYGRDIGFAVLNDTNRLSSTQHNSIIVPLGTVCQDSQEISHVFFTIFRGQKLFRGPQAYRSYGKKLEEDSNDEQSMNEFRERWKRDAIQPNKTEGVNQIPAPSRCVEQPSVPDVPVMSATLMIGGAQVHSFPRIMGVSRPPMAKLQFNTGKIPRPLHGQKIVTWFDESKQEWALEEKCKLESDENGIVSASCEHLTDFTVLIYGQLDAEQVCSWPLIIIGYSVNGASIFCLLLLIVIGLLFYIQTDTIRRILSYIRGQAQTSGDIINLSYYCIFLMFFVLSLFFMDQSSGGNEDDGTTTYCVVIAAMSYFSLISAIMMSMLIGIRMICHFFSPKLRAFFKVMTSPPAALSIGVIIPFTLTLILALFEREFFERNDAFCWVRPDYIAYAVIVPVILPIINGVICSTFAIYKMFFQAKRGLRDKETSHYDAEFWSKVLGLIIMQFAMGLPWGIEFILIGVAGSSAWNYVFVILLGTQGIDLFLIFLYRRQRLVNESRKWSAREEKMERKQRQLERSGEEG